LLRSFIFPVPNLVKPELTRPPLLLAGALTSPLTDFDFCRTRCHGCCHHSLHYCLAACYWLLSLLLELLLSRRYHPCCRAKLKLKLIPLGLLFVVALPSPPNEATRIS